MNTNAWKLLGTFAKFGATATGAGILAASFVGVKDTRTNGEPCCANQQAGDQRFNFPEADYPIFRKWNFNWDRMEPGLGGKIWPLNPQDKNSNPDGDCDCVNCNTNMAEKESKARRNIILIRHGQYNMDGGVDDKKHTLTSLGQEQAALTGKRLQAMGVKFTSIVSSALTRAMQTACIILENMDNQNCLRLEVRDPLLNEGAPCVPEPPYKKPELWNPDQRDVLVEGARIETAFRKYFHRAPPSQEEDSWEIIVCHGNVIRYFTCRAVQFPPEGWLRMSIDHCSIARFTILPTGEVILRGLGDSGHIPYEKQTVGSKLKDSNDDVM